MITTSKFKKTPAGRLAQLIKELRGNSSQREFAKLVGISYTTIQDWENQVRLPSAKNLERLSRLKGWTKSKLMNYLFAPSVEADYQTLDRDLDRADPIEQILSSLQHLSPEQIQALSTHLEASINTQAKSQDNVQ